MASTQATKTMRHWFMASPGNPSDLQFITDAPVPVPRRGEVRVKMAAAGLCYADAAIVRGITPAGQPEFPLVPGFDGVGRIDAVGDGVTTFAVGDTVAISSTIGCWSEYAVFPAKPTQKIVVTKVDLDGVSLEQAVAIIMNGQTAIQLLTRVRKLERGQRVLIHGVGGGVASLLAELAVHMGLEVYGTCSTRKLEQVRELPFGNKITLIDYTKVDFVQFVKALPAPAGVDMVFDGIGGDNFTRSNRCLRRRGNMVAYGITAYSDRGLTSSERFSLIFPFIRLKFNPFNNATFFDGYAVRKSHPDWFEEDVKRLFELVRTGVIQPKIHDRRFRLEEAKEALQMVVTSSIIGKGVFLFD